MQAEQWCGQHEREASELCNRCYQASRAQGCSFSEYFGRVKARADELAADEARTRAALKFSAEPVGESQRVASLALDAMPKGTRALVLVFDPTNPFHVSIAGEGLTPAQGIGLVEMAHFKLRVGMTDFGFEGEEVSPELPPRPDFAELRKKPWSG